MSSATKSPDAALRDAIKGKTVPPHISATFAGTIYKTAGSKGKEYVPFEQTVKVPLSVVKHEGYHPIAFFEKHHAENMVRKMGGVVSADSRHTRTCELVSVEGDLPPGLTLDQKLNWTADYAKLREIAESIGKVNYVRIDLKTEKRHQETVALNVDMYPTASRLRNAIKRVSDPETREAFAIEQAKLEEADKAAPKDMLAEIAALAE